MCIINIIIIYWMVARSKDNDHNQKSKMYNEIYNNKMKFKHV